jgi:hypothetical protein
MVAQSNIPEISSRRATTLKARLVTVGLFALSHGQWQMVIATTLLIQERGWSHV